MRYLLALWLLVVPIQATAFSAMQPEDCAAAWRIIIDGHKTDAAASARLSDDGWCLVPAAEAATEGFDFDRIEWRAEGLERLLEQSLPPTAVAIRVTDVDMLRKLGVAEIADAPSMAMQIVLVLRQNARDRQLLIEKLFITGPKGNEVFLTGVFHDVDLSSTGKMQVSLGSAKLRDVVLVATGTRGLERYIRPYFGTTFPERSRRRSKMIEKISNWPDHSFPPATKRAVEQLIAELPAPNGTLRAKVDTGPGISAGSFMKPVSFGEPTSEMIGRILATTVFHATWTHGE